jgi:hypothetical protein
VIVVDEHVQQARRVLGRLYEALARQSAAARARRSRSR